MRIIFLDFYGVMDGPLEKADWKEWSHFDPRCGELIRQLCLDYDARIVITSDAVQACDDLKFHDRLERAYKDLVDCGIPKDYIVGYLYQPIESISFWDRPTQIRKWVEDNQITDYVIFDDLPLLFEENKIQKYEEEIREEWKGTEEYRKKWIDRLPKPNPEAARRFIRVNSSKGLTSSDVQLARNIFEEL